MNSRHSDHPDHNTDARETDRWTVADLIDLEYYLSADEQTLRAGPTARNALTERDRALYLDRIAPAVAASQPHTAAHRRGSLRYWLRARRATEDPEQRLLLPGRTFTQAQGLTTLGLAILGFLVGSGAASALLSYDGHQPINVAWYVFLLVFVQFLLIGGAALGWLARRSRPIDRAAQDLTLLGRLVRPLVTRVSHWLLHQHLAATQQDVKDRTAAQVGRLRSQYALYGPVAFLPMLIPAQIFGVAFNVGAILTTIALEWFTDLAFGWGTALDLTPQFIHDLARAVAWPWGWLFGEGIGYPTLDQVAGSRILLKDPLFLLDASHLRSWRWFLVLAVCTYGLLPRLLLLGASLLTQRRLLERLPFTQGRTQALYARLLTPKVAVATHASGHGPAMPIPAPVTHHGPLARPIAGSPTRATTLPRSTESVTPASPTTAVRAVASRPVAGREESAVDILRALPLSRLTPATPPPVAEVIRTTAPTPAPPTAAPKSEATPEPGPARAPEPGPKSQPVPELRPEPTPEAESEQAAQLEPASVPTSEPVPESVPAPEAIPEFALETAAEPESAPAPPAAEPVPEPVPEAVLQPEARPEPAPETAAEPESTPALPPAAEPVPAPLPEPHGSEVPGGIAADACLLLVQLDVDELIEDTDRPRLAELVLALSGWRIAASASFGSGSAMTAGVVGWVEGQCWQAPPARVTLVMDGSQPPITENLRFLRELRAAAGTQAQILLALVGDPQDDDPLPPIRTFDFTDWRRKIDQLVDPYLRLEQLAPAHGAGDA